ncbi:SLC13 family permease [Aliikangiella sp. G2MR2-5]|uniref:SLC13 family permease n=1 Tax=Aliikangiella sp. G2MR2-5 TaxID=2788943 RepID=UPI0018A8EB88|nr:SLC13 family permease [Aliikangiella sp. G2MR2-5]
MATYITISIVAGCFITLFTTKKEPELIFGGGLLLLLIFNQVSIESALSGFASPGFFTVACLYVVAAGIKETGLLQPVLNQMLGNVRSYRRAHLNITIPVSALSSVMNNTPIVAALLPGISSWCRSNQWSKRGFLLPLSYAAIMGGTCTVIGSSTNLLIFGFLQQSSNSEKLGFFDLGLVGLPITIFGILFLVLFTKRILGEDDSSRKQAEKTREYTVEMIVAKNGPLEGKTIEQANLRKLKGLYLIEIIRGDLILAAVSPSTKLSGGDRLVFTGKVTSISDLINVEGLKVAEDQVFKLANDTGKATMVEVVVGASNPLAGKTVKQVGFRKQYNAVIIAVLREGERIDKKIGDIRLERGDTLLMLARRSFIEQYRYSKDFLLVHASHELSIRPSSKRAYAFFFTVGFIIAAASGLIPVVVAAMAAALLMVLFGCISLELAKKSIDLQVLLTIGSAYGIGAAMTEGGSAQLIAQALVNTVGSSPFGLLVATYFLTVILTELITNNAAAVLSYSLISSVVIALGYNIVPYAVAIMIAASASFISPLGYQTNLMVYSAGRYQFKDYIKLGIPLSIISALISLGLIPVIWELS